MKSKQVISKKSNGDEVTLIVKIPTPDSVRESAKVAASAFKEAMQGKYPLRVKLEEYIKEQKLWTEEKDDELKVLSNKLRDGARKLAKGKGAFSSLEDAVKLSYDMQDTRHEFNMLTSAKTNLDTYSAEGYADSAKFNFLFINSVFYEDGQKVYNSIEDFYKKETEPYTSSTLVEFVKLFYENDNTEALQKIPENAFLIKVGKMNKEGSLIDAQNRLVDRTGRLIDKDGRYINEKGEYVDIDGQLVDKDGNPVEDYQPFGVELN